MPKVRTSRTRIPAGFEVLQDTLDELEQKMRDAENEPHDGKRKNESLWPVFRLNHQRSRYIFDMYKTKKITRPVYDFCLREKYADANLIAKWKKNGFEKLCCLQCMQTRDHNCGTTCICRVPRKNTPEDGVECVTCGCRGCASSD